MSEPFVYEISSSTAQVRGPETLVSNINKVEACVEAESVGNELKTITANTRVVDYSGEIIEGVAINPETVSVTTILLNKKTVQLSVPVIGMENSNINRTVSVPKVITIKGTDASLSTITAIGCEEVDVSEIFETTTITLVPKLPEGIDVASNSAELIMEVTVSGVSSRTFNISSDKIKLIGAGNYGYVITPAFVNVDVTGLSYLISTVSDEDFTLSCDVTNLAPGEYKLPLSCEVSKEGVEKTECKVEEISVIITDHKIDDESEDNVEETE